MAKTQWRGGAMLGPLPPVLVTTGSLQSPNVCTVAWCGMLATKPPATYVSLQPIRHSHGLLQQNGEFVIHLPTVRLAAAIDTCGVLSGRDVDKFARCGLTPAAASQVAPPLIEECPVALECRVRQVLPMGSHDVFIADILCVDVDEALIDEHDRLDLGAAGLLAFAHGEYYALGRKVGGFGFSVRRRKKGPPKGRKKP